MAGLKRRRIRPDWWSKTFAGALLGLSLAFLASGLFLKTATIQIDSAKAQLAMWMVIPVWMGVFSTAYLFVDGKRAWWWLGSANLLLFGAYLLAGFPRA